MTQLLIPPLIFLPMTWSFDGCLFAEYYRCGDLCIPQSSQCHCGNTTLTFVTDYDKYCCNNVPCEAIDDGDYDRNLFEKDPKPDYGDGVCGDGEVLSLSQPCQENCPFQQRENRSFIDYW